MAYRPALVKTIWFSSITCSIVASWNLMQVFSSQWAMAFRIILFWFSSGKKKKLRRVVRNMAIWSSLVISMTQSDGKKYSLSYWLQIITSYCYQLPILNGQIEIVLLYIRTALFQTHLLPWPVNGRTSLKRWHPFVYINTLQSEMDWSIENQSAGWDSQTRMWFFHLLLKVTYCVFHQI